MIPSLATTEGPQAQQAYSAEAVLAAKAGRYVEEPEEEPAAEGREYDSQQRSI